MYFCVAFCLHFIDIVFPSRAPQYCWQTSAWLNYKVSNNQTRLENNTLRKGRSEGGEEDERCMRWKKQTAERERESKRQKKKETVCVWGPESKKGGKRELQREREEGLYSIWGKFRGLMMSSRPRPPADGIDAGVSVVHLSTLRTSDGWTSPKTAGREA